MPPCGWGQEDAVRGPADRDGLKGAGRRVEDPDLLDEALGDPELPIRREVDAVRPAGDLVAAQDRQGIRVQRRGRPVDAVVDPEQLAVRGQENLMRAAPGPDLALDPAIDRI